MFRKLPPGPVNQLNIELNAKKCFVWLFDTLKMRTNFFLWQIIHWYTQTKHTSGLVNFTNIKETFLSKCIFMNYDFLNLNRKLLASHGEFLYMKRGKFAAFFQRSACNFESNIAIQSPLGLHQIRIRHETFSLFWGKFRKVHLLMYMPNHCFHFYSITELPYKIHKFSSSHRTQSLHLLSY